MTKKVFYKDIVLIFTSAVFPKMDADSQEMSRELSKIIEQGNHIDSYFKEMNQQQSSNTIYLRSEYFKPFKQIFKLREDGYIKAGGGLVVHSKKKLLFIFRNGCWDLPKGKQEKGELLKQTAIREVAEEIGYDQIILKDFFQTTYHIYHRSHYILKKTKWFLMKLKNDKVKFTPQEKEGITMVKWFDKENIIPMQDETYPLINELLIKFIGRKK